MDCEQETTAVIRRIRASLPYKVAQEVPAYTLATSGATFIQLVRTAMKVSTIAAIDIEITALARAGKRVLYLAVLEAGVDLAIPQNVREAMNAMVAKHRGDFAAAAIVFEARGFKATVMRSIVTGVNLASRVKHPNRVFSDANVGIHWLTSFAELEAGTTAHNQSRQLQAILHDLRMRHHFAEDNRDSLTG